MLIFFAGRKAKVLFVRDQVLDLALDLDQNLDLARAPNHQSPFLKLPLLRQKNLHQRQRAAPGAPRAALKAPKVLQVLDKLAPKVLQGLEKLVPKMLQGPDKLAPKAALKALKVLQDLDKLPPKVALRVLTADPGALRANPRAPRVALEVHPPLAPALRAPKKRADAILFLIQCLEIALKQVHAPRPAPAPLRLLQLKMPTKMSQWIRTNLL